MLGSRDIRKKLVSLNLISTGLFIPLIEAETLLLYQFLPRITISWGENALRNQIAQNWQNLGGLSIDFKGLASPRLSGLLHLESGSNKFALQINLRLKITSRMLEKYHVFQDHYY